MDFCSLKIKRFLILSSFSCQNIHSKKLSSTKLKDCLYFRRTLGKAENQKFLRFLFTFFICWERTFQEQAQKKLISFN